MVSLYPNPTSGLITVSTPVTGSYLLHSISGVLLKTEKAPNSFTINTNNLNNGIYILHIKSDKGIAVKKITVKK